MRFQRIIKTIIGIIIIIGILVGMGYGVSTLLNNDKSAFYFEVNPNGEVMEEVVVDDIIVDKGTKIILPTPERVGYTFDGWYFDRDYSGGYYRGGEEISSDSSKTQLYAKWSVKKFTVVIYNEFNDSQTKYTENVSYQKSIYLDRYISQNEELGYTYSWKDASGVIISEANVVITGDCTFTRVREVKVYNLRYIYEADNEDVVLGEDRLSFGKSFDFSNIDMQRVGYSFKDKCTLKNGTEIASGTLLDKSIIKGVYNDTIVLYPVYEIMKFSVKFYTYDDALLSTLSYDYNSLLAQDDLSRIESNATLTRDHYVFKGWSYKGQLLEDISTFRIPTEDVDLVATYEKEKYEIKYFISVGETKYFDTITKEYGDSLVGTIPTDEQIATLIGDDSKAYEFYGLKYNNVTYDKETFEQTFTSANNMEIEVLLNQTKLIIKYFAGDGETIYKKSFLDIDSQIILPDTPTSEYAPKTSDTDTSYVFGGWILKDGTAFDESFDLSTINGSLDVYSEWFEYNQNKWKAGLNSDGVTAYVVEYLGDYKNVCVPSQVLLNFNPYKVTTIGDESINGAVGNIEGRKILIRSNITTIAYRAFFNIENTSIIFDDDDSNNSLSIGEMAFGSLTEAGTQKSIKSITLPKRTTSVDSLAFGSAISLERVDVVSGCENYKSVDGVLYEVNGKDVILHTYPHAKSGTEFVVPSDVTKIGDNGFYYYNGTNAIESTLEVVKTSKTTALKTIGENSFKNATNLTRVDFSTAPIDTIGASAFEGCFNDCSSHELLFNPTCKILRVGASAFKNCYFVTKISIDLSNLQEIGESAFYFLAGKVAVNNTLELVEEDLSVTLKDLTNIPNYAFCNSQLFLTIIDTKDVTIGESAFGKSIIKSAVFNGKLTLGDYAFSEARIDYIQFDHVEDIKINMFEYTSVTSIKVDYLKNVEYVNGKLSVFYNNKSLKTFVFGENCSVDALTPLLFSGCISLESVTLPKDIEVIPAYVFYGCESLIIDIPESVKAIEGGAFYGCKKIERLDLTLTSLSSDAFNETGLKYVYIKFVGDNCSMSGAFVGCTSLKTIILDGKVPVFECKSSVSLYLFYKITPMKIYIPQGTKAEYLAIDKWVEYEEYLTEVDLSSGMVKDNGKLLKVISNIDTITVPNDVTALSDYAFSGLSNLKVLNLNTTSVLTASDITYLFDDVNTDTLVIKVPNDLLDAYKSSTFWASYINNFVGVDF